MIEQLKRHMNKKTYESPPSVCQMAIKEEFGVDRSIEIRGFVSE